jgi:voltage-gated potassium channel
VLNRQAKIRLRDRVAIYVAGGASLVAFCAALAVLDAERSSPDANITDFGDAIWLGGHDHNHRRLWRPLPQ